MDFEDAEHMASQQHTSTACKSLRQLQKKLTDFSTNQHDLENIPRKSAVKCQTEEKYTKQPIIMLKNRLNCSGLNTRRYYCAV